MLKLMKVTCLCLLAFEMTNCDGNGWFKQEESEAPLNSDATTDISSTVSAPAEETKPSELSGSSESTEFLVNSTQTQTIDWSETTEATTTTTEKRMH